VQLDGSIAIQYRHIPPHTKNALIAVRTPAIPQITFSKVPFASTGKNKVHMVAAITIAADAPNHTRAFAFKSHSSLNLFQINEPG
jgi:hypothetical protein